MRKEQIITTTNNNQMEEKGMKQRFIPVSYTHLDVYKRQSLMRI